MSESMSLVVIPAASLPTILAADDKDILAKLVIELDGFEPDVSTPKGREEIASKAHKVATAKMDLIRLGKSLTEGWREQTKAVNEECKLIETRMDSLRDQVRAPLNEYQAKEKRRVEAHETALSEFTFIMGAAAGFPTSREIADTIAQVTYLHAGREWEEFTARARKAREATLDTLRAVYQTARTREDQAEAARLAAEEQAERDRIAAEKARQEREEQIAAEAARHAKALAEEKAAREAAEVQKRAHAALEAARLEFEQKEREAAVALERAEKHRLEAIERQRAVEEKAEADRVAAIARAEADMLAAIEAERLRIAAAVETQRKIDEKRAANIAHQRAVNREIVEDLMSSVEWAGGLPEALARLVVTAIAKGSVRHTKILY